jgi:hypothetical protein
MCDARFGSALGVRPRELKDAIILSHFGGVVDTLAPTPGHRAQVRFCRSRCVCACDLWWKHQRECVKATAGTAGTL